jgi:hypothetical protein
MNESVIHMIRQIFHTKETFLYDLLLWSSYTSASYTMCSKDTHRVYHSDYRSDSTVKRIVFGWVCPVL